MLRLVTWNIRDLLGDPLAVHRVLRALAPDVLCLQEAPRRPGGGLRIGAIARATGLRHLAGGRTSGGTAVLVAPGVEVASVSAFRLPVAHWHTRRRGAVITTVRSGPLHVRIASVHLPLTPDDRQRHAEAVCAALVSAPVPPHLVVAGDLNEPENSPAWQVFARVVGDPRPGAAPTFPAQAPHGRIDAVLVSRGLEALTYDDGGADLADVRRASDHLPVLAVLRRAPEHP